MTNPEDELILVTLNGPGNVHETASYLNKAGLAPLVLQIEYSGGHHSTVLLRMTVKAKEYFKSKGKL